MSGGGGAEARLVLGALMDAHDAPGHMVVDGGRLAGQPDQGHQGEGAVRRDVQDVGPVPRGVPDPVLREQQVGRRVWRGRRWTTG